MKLVGCGVQVKILDCDTKMTIAYQATPLYMKDFISSGVSLPSWSQIRSRFEAHRTVAMKMKRVSLATCFPGQARLPKPYVLCPSSRASGGVTICPSASKN